MADGRKAAFEVALSLKRSKARRHVLRCLVESGPSYPSEISRKAGLDLPATLGALRGLGKRYAPQRSLAGLGLAEEVQDPGLVDDYRVKLYEATHSGRQALEMIKDTIRRSD